MKNFLSIIISALFLSNCGGLDESVLSEDDPIPENNLQEETSEETSEEVLTDTDEQIVSEEDFLTITKDNKNNVYNAYFETPNGREVVFRDIDPTSFRLIDIIYTDLAFGLDENYVYTEETGKYAVDSATFQILNECYARDKNQIFSITYYVGAYLGLLTEADPATFHILGDKCIAKDEDTIYTSLPSYEGTSIGTLEGADAPTFEILDGFAKDKNKIYINISSLGGPGLKALDLELDMASFQRSSDGSYFYDKNAIFLGYLELGRYENIDQPSFKIAYEKSFEWGTILKNTVLLKAEDKNHHYELVADDSWDEDSIWSYDSELHKTEWVILD